MQYLIHTGPKQCLICTSDFGAVLLSALLVLVAIFSVIMLYRNTMLSGSTLCTEYEALTTETILCGMGDSCSASGMNVSVGGQYTTNQAIKTWLVPRDELKSYNRQREPVRFEGPLTSSILFSSPTVTYYSWRETVVSGNCCIINNGGTTAQVTLEIFPTYHSAIKLIQKDAIFRENISVKSNNTQCFDKWGPGKPFVAEIDGYFFFSLSTSTEVNYIFEMVTKQVYVNGMQYRDPHYFTSSNYSALAYGKCFENSGVHKQPEDYIILCKATSEDVETESLEILSCPLHLSSPYKNLWLSLMAVFSILALIFIVIAACIFWRGKLWKIRKQPQQECTTDSSELLVT